MNYDLIFYWIGVVSAALFVLLGMAVFSGWVMTMIWRRFMDGKDLGSVIAVWHASKADIDAR